MSGATLKQAQAAIDRAGLPLELVRGEGYHYVIYDRPALNIFETESIYVPYTSHMDTAGWVAAAELAWATIKQACERRGLQLEELV